MDIRELIMVSSKFLRDHGVESFRLDSEVLISYLLGISREKLYMDLGKEVKDDIVGTLWPLLERRSMGEPIAYITGKKEFMGLDFEVNPSVMIPRPETETLVEEAILASKRIGARIALDMCTGSGNVAISLAIFCPSTFVVASDISIESAGTAKRNARKHGVEGRVAIVVGDKWGPFKEGSLDLLICNPPYVPSPVLDSLDERSSLYYEPRIALDGGEDGLDFYRAVLPYTAKYLRDGGIALFEVGHGQAEYLVSMLREEGCWDEIWIKKDLSGTERVVGGRKIG